MWRRGRRDRCRLATLNRFLFVWSGGRQDRGLRAAKLGNRRQQLSPMPQRNANLFKIGVCQVAEHRDINVVVNKCRRVSLQANLRQPFRNLLHRRPCADLPATGRIKAYQF
jgi:hypothetical protein